MVPKFKIGDYVFFKDEFILKVFKNCTILKITEIHHINKYEIQYDVDAKGDQNIPKITNIREIALKKDLSRERKEKIKNLF